MKKILETSLVRVYEHMQNHETGFITAYRSEYSHKENQQRNRSLLSKLQNKRYGVTSVSGCYIENYNSPEAKEVGEHTFFVVDLFDKLVLKEDLKIWGMEFDQDSILFIEKGGEKGYIIGTSKRENSWPGFGVSILLNSPVFGKDGEFYTKVRNRPFVFAESFNSPMILLPEGYMARLACNAVSKMKWQDIWVCE